MTKTSNLDAIQQLISKAKEQKQEDSYLSNEWVDNIIHLMKADVLPEVLYDFDLGDIKYQVSHQRTALFYDMFSVKFKNNAVGLDELKFEVKEETGKERPLKLAIYAKLSRISRAVMLKELLVAGFSRYIEDTVRNKNVDKQEATRKTAYLEALRFRKNEVVVGALGSDLRVKLTVPDQLQALADELDLQPNDILMSTADFMVEEAKNFGTVVE